MSNTMNQFLNRFWQDEHGTVLSAELMMLTTLLALGVIVGAKSFRDGAVTEFADYAQAIGNLDQSYNVPDDMGDPGSGSGFLDERDFCDEAGATPTMSTNNDADTWGSGGGKFADPVEFVIAPSGE